MERTKTIEAVGYAEDPKEGTVICELADPRHAYMRVTTEVSVGTGRAKEWDLVRVHPLDEVLDKLSYKYRNKYKKTLENGSREMALLWVTQGWAKIKNARPEGEVTWKHPTS